MSGGVLLLRDIVKIINTLNDYDEEYVESAEVQPPPRGVIMRRARRLMKSLLMHGARLQRHPGYYGSFYDGDGGYQWNFWGRGY